MCPDVLEVGTLTMTDMDVGPLSFYRKARLDQVPSHLIGRARGGAEAERSQRSQSP